jgi:hypothetical protein
MIDFILCSPGMATRYVEKSMRVISGTVESSGSDHNPVVMRFDMRKPGTAGGIARGAASTASGE